MAVKPPFRISRWSVLIIFFTIALIHAGENFASLSPFRMDVRNGHSVIDFNLPAGWKIKILNESPAIKIIAKIYNPIAESNPFNKNAVELRSDIGISRCQVTPLTSGSSLFVFELAENMTFESAAGTGGRIVIHNEQYFDEAERAYRQGLQFHANNQLHEALSAYRQAVFLKREHGNAYFKAGQIRFAFKQYRLAEINFKNALRLNCDSLNLYRDLAKLYRIEGKTDQAEKYSQIFESRLKALYTPADASGPDLAQNSPQEKEQAESESALSAEVSKRDSAAVPLTAAAGQGMPIRIIFYLAGIAVFAVFILLSIFLHFLKKKRTSPAFPDSSAKALFDDGEDLKKSAIPIRQQSLRPSSKPESGTETSRGTLQKPEIKMTNDVPSPPGKTAKAEESWQLSDNPTPWEKMEAARNLNLGVGEIELALNMTAQQRQVSKKNYIHSEIERLHHSRMSISEIARQLNLGQDEVKLILAMNHAHTENELVH